MVPVVGRRVGTGRIVVVGACSPVGAIVVVVGVTVAVVGRIVVVGACSPVGARVVIVGVVVAVVGRIVVVGACSPVGARVVIVGDIVAVVGVPAEGIGLGGKVICEAVGNDVGISVNWIGGLGVGAITQ
jgi:hypothetical protein